MVDTSFIWNAGVTVASFLLWLLLLSSLGEMGKHFSTAADAQLLTDSWTHCDLEMTFLLPLPRRRECPIPRGRPACYPYQHIQITNLVMQIAKENIKGIACFDMQIDGLGLTN